MRCQYVSGLLLQCKNILPPNANVSSTTGQSSSSSTITDSTNNFCEKHQAFIDNIKIHANVSRSVLDPGYKLPSHLDENEEILLSSKRPTPSHVFEPCCSDSTAFSDDNPLRFAGYLTDKEIVQQYSAAIGRMINKVNDMRFIIYSRYMEHLKKKPAVQEERKKYKLYVRDAEERARLERLKSDMAYARYNRTAATYMQKSYRKFKAEQKEVRGRENIRTWLESPVSPIDDKRCEFLDDIDSSTTVEYVSPKNVNESNPDECVKAILGSILNTVEEKELASIGKKRCTSQRLPMTDFCTQHLKLDADIKLFGTCKECGAPCLEFDNCLCSKHAKPRFVPPPTPVQIPMGPVQTISQRLPTSKERNTRIPSIGSNLNGWNISTRHLQHQIIGPGYSTLPTIRKPEIKYDISSLSGPLTLKSRSPRDKYQKIIQSERQPNEALLAEQAKLNVNSLQNIQIMKIDDDMPMKELNDQCEQRMILDTTANAPLNHQPKTKRSMLRLNGANGTGIVIRGPIAIIENPHQTVGRYNSNTINVANRNGTVNGMVLPGCARTRIFTGKDRGGDKRMAQHRIQ